MIGEGVKATTNSGEGAALVWSGRAWMFDPQTPCAPCPNEDAKQRAFSGIFDAARRAKGKSERACVLLENYSHVTGSWRRGLS